MVEFITPIVKATNSKNKTVLSFYTMPEYEAWRESLGGNASGWSIKYYKGLGTSTSKEGKEYFQDSAKHKKDFMWADEQDGDAIELAFSKKKIEARKNWLRNFEPGTYLDQQEKLIKYSDFVNKELILFSMADLQRSIPSMVDGLKPGQRKILFCSFKRNFVKELKVAQFSGYVSEHSAYHHGEQSLASTIIGMAQDFVGSNNINLLQPNGQFGTRHQGGKDHASARYIYTRLSPVTRFLFPKDDDILLDYLNEDGQSIEPTWYEPIIPTVLVNGSEGIGTGWSSFVPNYNPRDIIANIRRLLQDETMQSMDPWYRGFKGSIEKTSTKEAGATYTMTGVIEVVDNTTLIITELPIRRWTQDYKEFLESLMTGTDKDYREHNDDVNVHFEVSLSEKSMNIAMQEGLEKKFKLTTTISTTNMHLFDPNGVIKKYETPEQVLEDFFHLRLDYFVKRKRVLLENLELSLLKLDNKVRFILGVVHGEIIVNNRKRAELFHELRQKGFTPFPKKSKGVDVAVAGTTEEADEVEESPEAVKGEVKASDYEYLLSLAIGTLTLEKVQELCAEKDKLENEVEELRRASPRSLWIKDLDALEAELDELDRKDAEAEGVRKKMRAKNAGGAAVSRPAPKRQPKKTAANAEKSEVYPSDAVDTLKPRAAPARQKKAPEKANVIESDDEDDEMLELKHRLPTYNLDSSPDQMAMETAATNALGATAGQKEPSKRAAAAKKSSAILELSDDEDVLANTVDDDDDGDFVEEEAPAKKQTRGRKPASSKPATAAAPTRKRATAAKNQKLITEVLKPAESTSTSGTSPEKKGVAAAAVAAAKERPKREIKHKAVYIESDTEEEEQQESDNSEFSQFSEDDE